MATALATHEAGHAVIAFARGIPVTRVTVDPSDPSGPRMELAPGGVEALDSRDMLTVWLAGAAAEARATGRPPVLDAADRAQANAMASVCCEGDSDRAAKYLDEHQLIADALVVTHQPWIEKVADELDRCTTLPGFRVMQLKPVPADAIGPAVPNPPTAAAIPVPRDGTPELLDPNTLISGDDVVRRRELDLHVRALIRALPEGLNAWVAKKIEAAIAPWQAHSEALEQRIAELERRPSLKYLGTWQWGHTYKAGDCVTHAGSLWIAHEATTAQPGQPQLESRAWQLAVKNGAVKNGKAR